MCMNCGCGEDDKRHHRPISPARICNGRPIGSGMTLRDTAENITRSTSKLADGQPTGSQSTSTASVR
jgi:hypothetical protein